MYLHCISISEFVKHLRTADHPFARLISAACDAYPPSHIKITGAPSCLATAVQTIAPRCDAQRQRKSLDSKYGLSMNIAADVAISDSLHASSTTTTCTTIRCDALDSPRGTQAVHRSAFRGFARLRLTTIATLLSPLKSCVQLRVGFIGIVLRR